MPFDQMGHDVDMCCITCCDERAPRKTYGNKERLACGTGARLPSWKPGDGMWQGLDPASMRGAGKDGFSFADLSWIIVETQAK